MNKKADFFQKQVESYAIKIGQLKSRSNTISLLRFSIFIAFAIAVIWAISMHNSTMLSILVVAFIIVFAMLVYQHKLVKSALEMSQTIQEINMEELSRTQYHFAGIADGSEYLDDHHPYTGDLDVFGRNSLFQLVNRAGTWEGLERVKNWLSTFATKSTIETRQAMVKELIPLVQWRQNLQAFGRNKRTNNKNHHAFGTWIKESDFIGKNRFYKVLPYAMICLSLALIVAMIYGLIPWTLIFLPFFISTYFLFIILNYSRQTYEMTEAGVKMLSSAERMLKLVEEQEFQHPQLTLLQSRLKTKNMMASQKIGELRKILEWLNLRGNQMYHIFNGLFLLDYLFLAKAEQWRADFGTEVEVWFDTIAEFEALGSLAAFAFANEEFIFPTISEQASTYQCTVLGHPLIPPHQRISNDFTIEGRGSAGVITGSNMAGKSTFLRTVGINAVLAFAGAPVCAESMTLSVFQVFSSMRTKDNLEENISSFYAELLRLKMLLEQINDTQTIFYLLDEILKGTNSADRHIGAESLILQLNKMNVFGLVSTHDLELGKLGDQNEWISNYNFNSTIEGEEIIFDYKLRPGICQSTNASQLMAKIGIQIKP